MQDVTSEQVAWFAGLFEGEGYLSFSKERRKGRSGGHWRLGLGMSDEDIINRIQTMFGGSIHKWTLSHKKPTYKDMFSWNVTKQAHILEIVDVIYPLMGKRRQAKFDEFITYYNTPRPTQSDRMKQRWSEPSYRAANLWSIKKAADTLSQIRQVAHLSEDKPLDQGDQTSCSI